MSLGIPTCSADDDPDAMYAKLDAAGCLIVHDAASSDQVAAVRAELVDHMASARVADDKPTAFYPGITRRVVALMHRSPTVRELMMHPITEALGDRHLGQNCSKWTLNVTAALEVGPGARDQILHREEDLYPYFPLPRPNLILASMWAMSDFTADNGGTQLVPGSHRWDAERTATPDEVVRAQMPAGSVLYWLGGTLHGAGANSTPEDWRYGIILTYNLGWLRQEENQHVSIPLADVLALPDAMRSRLGFDMDYENSLGFYDRSVLAPRPAEVGT
ncbi:MAG: phytanoyl-CoA dioxygenase family protein [Acidimicrobiaceae bacterium]|nr:phytanoyl-CoA dioxygenase family protein [Acidimicrobiaceae bacterium]